MVGRIYGKGKFWVDCGTEIEWCICESGDNDRDDDEPVRERWDDSDRDSSSTGWRSSLGSSFQRRGEAWRKERCWLSKRNKKVNEQGDNIRGSCGWREIRLKGEVWNMTRVLLGYVLEFRFRSSALCQRYLIIPYLTYSPDWPESSWPLKTLPAGDSIGGERELLASAVETWSSCNCDPRKAQEELRSRIENCTSSQLWP